MTMTHCPRGEITNLPFTAQPPADVSTSDPDVSRIQFGTAVLLTKEEVFGACQALADASGMLLRAGRIAEATALGDLFELLERRLVVPRK
jgi:hypothetical protein